MNDAIKSRMRLFEQCPVCNSADLVPLSARLLEGPLLKCSTCGHFVSSCTSKQHEDALWKWDNASGTNPDAKSLSRHQQVSTRRLTTAIKLLRTSSQPPHLLDVGCSSGSLLAVAANMGLSVSGVEPATVAAEAAQKAGFDVHAGYLNQANYPDNHFDIVTLFEIVEHLSDPSALVNECRRILKAGGVLAINTPNGASWTAKFMGHRWEGFSLVKLGGHVSFFTPDSMKFLVHHTDLSVAKIETRNVRFFERGQCSPTFFRAAKIAAQLLAYPARILGQGHDLLIFLRKEVT